jgi:hypothetical protein
MKMRGWLAFQDLKPGDSFRFQHYLADTGSPTVYRKRNAQWFEDATGRKFRTGKLSAVVHVTDAPMTDDRYSRPVKIY